MSINPSTEFVGKIDNSVPLEYPYGKAQNITAPGDGLGTPLVAALLNDIFGFQQALLKYSGIVPSGTPDKLGASQYLQSIVELASGRAFNYTDDSVSSLNYIINNASDQQTPSSYFEGMVIRFRATFDSVANSTINVVGLGVRFIKFKGLTLKGAEIVSGNYVELIIDNSGDVNLILTTHKHNFDDITPVIGAGLSTTVVITHGLYEDNLDLSLKISGDEYVCYVAHVAGFNYRIVGNNGIDAPMSVTNPSSGTIELTIKNTSGVPQAFTYRGTLVDRNY